MRSMDHEPGCNTLSMFSGEIVSVALDAGESNPWREDAGIWKHDPQ